MATSIVKHGLLGDSTKSRMLEIIIEDDTFRPLWDSSHADYKLRNKQHFYELLKDRLTAENHRIESSKFIW